MWVLKPINNNIVSCRDENGQELIAMGRGLGYSLRAGDYLDECKVEKLFHMKTQDEACRLIELFSNLPPYQIELCSQIVDRAHQELGCKLNPSIYLTLTDHICFAIERLRCGIVFRNKLMAEVLTFYPQEYKIGKHALKQLAQKMHVYFPDDEAANIALHLVNAEYDNTISDTLRITDTLHDILTTLNDWPHLRLDTDSAFYNEFTVYLKFLVLRAYSGSGNLQRDERFVETVRQCYPHEFQCAGQIVKELERCTQNILPPEEQAYLATSLHRTCHFV